MCKDYNNPALGDTLLHGTETKIYTERGWVICENQNEVDEEKSKIENYIKNGEPN